MKILVTGNCGFIGQNFVRIYRDQFELVGLDKLGYASDIKAMALCPTWKLDIAKDDLNPVFSNTHFDGIINFAAASHVDNSIKSPEEFMYSNYMGTFNLLEMARKYNVKRFYQFSSDEVFGDLSTDDEAFLPDAPLKPSSPYSASKAAADLLVLSYKRTYRINVVISRACNNYGPYQYPEKFIPVVITKALNNQSIPVYGAGQNIREWIYVKDCCKGAMTIFLTGENKPYNLGSNMERTNLDLVKQILTLLNKPFSLIQMVEDRKGHDFRYALNSEQTYKELQWAPLIHLDAGLKKTIEWYKENQNYWEK